MSTSTIVETIDGAFDGADAPPAYEGPEFEAHRYLVPGLYRAIATYGDDAQGNPITEVGWLTVWDENSHYPSMGISPNSHGSIFLGLGCGMMCSGNKAPHNHTVAELTGEWW